MVTISDIAKKANVNKSTVSKALNNSGDINFETAVKIRAVAKELGYEKRIRKTSSQKTIGIITAEIDDAYYSGLVENVISIAQSQGYTCCVLTGNYDPVNEERAVRFMIDKNVSGVFFGLSISRQVNRLYEKLKECGIPVVGVAEESVDTETDKIWINDKDGVDQAIEHLYSLGHERIAYIGDKYGMERLESFKSAMQKRNLPVLENLISLAPERKFECGYKGVKSLLDKKERFTAIFAQYDDVAIGAIRALTESGISVPNDVSIIGADDTKYCSFITPTLTSINCNSDALCQVAFKILQNKINKKDKSVQSVLIKPKLVVRESTAKAKSFET